MISSRFKRIGFFALLLVVAIGMLWFGTRVSFDEKVPRGDAKGAVGAGASHRDRGTQATVSENQSSREARLALTTTNSNSAVSQALTKLLADPKSLDAESIATRLSLLRNDADRGHVKTSCYLGIALSRCVLAKEQLRSSNAKDAPKELIDTLARCEGVSTEQMNLATQYLLHAAQSGSAAAIVDYVSIPPFSEQAFTDHLEEWAQYRENAPRLLQQGVERGDVGSLWYAYFASIGGPTPGGTRLAETDAYTQIMYGTTVARAVAGESARRAQARVAKIAATPDLDPNRVAAARAAGGALYLRAFASKAPVEFAGNYGISSPSDCF